MHSFSNTHYNKYLQPQANKLRKSMTKAEACLWKYVLRGKQLGFTFNRQRPVLNYIADFMCKDLKLIIETDGITHQSEEQSEKDRRRQKALEENGFTVLRFQDNEVLHNIVGVRERIEEVIRVLAKREVGNPYAIRSL
jgi:very-short-patch-repair endonuclease